MNNKNRLGGLRIFFTLIALTVLLLSACPSDPVPGRESERDFSHGGIEKATDNTKRLWNYLTDMYGNYIISGQMDAAWANNGDLDMISRVFTDTGKYPAIKGFDFIDLPNSWGGFGQDQVDEAIEWWNGENKNNTQAGAATKLLPDKPEIRGIVTFCWHWRMPAIEGSNQEFYVLTPNRNNRNSTDFRIPMKDGELDTESAEYQRIVEDLDKVAVLLQQLKDLDIPVLWRPLHEAAGNWSASRPNGAWFWWGASGPGPYIALWEFMYEYLSKEKGLNNLIWVWNGQHVSWYPDPATVDIVGYDFYPWPRDTPERARQYGSQSLTFNRARNMADGQRMVALTENGAIPNPDLCKEDNAMWLWFMVWNDARRDTWIAQNGPDDAENFWSGEFHNTNAHKNHVYNHNLVITLDKLPNLTTYRLQ